MKQIWLFWDKLITIWGFLLWKFLEWLKCLAYLIFHHFFFLIIPWYTKKLWKMTWSTNMVKCTKIKCKMFPDDEKLFLRLAAGTRGQPKFIFQLFYILHRYLQLFIKQKRWPDWKSMKTLGLISLQKSNFFFTISLKSF